MLNIRNIENYSVIFFCLKKKKKILSLSNVFFFCYYMIYDI